MTSVSLEIEEGRVSTRCSRTNMLVEKNSSAPCRGVFGGQSAHWPAQRVRNVAREIFTHYYEGIVTNELCQIKQHSSRQTEIICNERKLTLGNALSKRYRHTGRSKQYQSCETRHAGKFYCNFNALSLRFISIRRLQSGGHSHRKGSTTIAWQRAISRVKISC